MHAHSVLFLYIYIRESPTNAGCFGARVHVLLAIVALSATCCLHQLPQSKLQLSFPQMIGESSQAQMLLLLLWAL